MSPEALSSVEDGGSREHAQGSAGEEEREMEASEAMKGSSRGPQGLHELGLPHLVLAVCAL